MEWLSALTGAIDALVGPVFLALQWVLLAYVLVLQFATVGLCWFAFRALRRYRDRRRFNLLPLSHGEFNLPISLLVPAYNEAAGIVASVRSMLQIDYPRYEIVVINDGSKDGTLQELIRHFGLQVFPEAIDQPLPCAEIRAIYRSRRYPTCAWWTRPTAASRMRSTPASTAPATGWCAWWMRIPFCGAMRCRAWSSPLSTIRA